jgi:agmatinase
LRLPHRTDLAGVDVAILGVPFDSGTSYRSGARLGPREIRAQSSLIRPYSYFQKVSPFETLAVVDAGDVDAPPVGLEKAYEAIEQGVTRDHSISFPILKAIAATHGPVSLIQFDAHIATWGDYCDVVEVAPTFDGPGHITSLLAANIMFELLCVIARKGGS